jgi:hypothetical protein
MSDVMSVACSGFDEGAAVQDLCRESETRYWSVPYSLVFAFYSLAALYCVREQMVHCNRH